jgi:integrase
MSEAGIPIETIADQLGHDGTRMTLLIYRHATKPTVSAGNAMTGFLTHDT